MSQSVRILPLHLRGPRHARLRQQLFEAQGETARLWNDCVTWHRPHIRGGGEAQHKLMIIGADDVG